MWGAGVALRRENYKKIEERAAPQITFRIVLDPITK